MADVSPGMKICDPACGVGKFLLELILNDLDRFYKIESTPDGSETLVPQIVLSGFDKGFDKDEQKTIDVAKLLILTSFIQVHIGQLTAGGQEMSELNLA